MSGAKTRKTLKTLHTLATCGLVGGMVVYGALLIEPPTDPQTYAALRSQIADISNWILLPSLGLALVTGLVAMALHRPFLEKRWVWVKAVMGILMFKGVLTLISAKSQYAARVAADIAEGTAPPDALDSLMAAEWWTLAAMLALSIANVVLGVWRPRLKKRTDTAVHNSSQSQKTAKPAG